MAILFLIGGAVLLLCLGAKPSRRSSTSPAKRSVAAEQPSATDLALDDPVAALLSYGTPADAARLAEQGVDLGALGYRPPSA